MRHASRLLALLLLLPAPATAQKPAFVDALIAFHSALPGTYGDEGRVVAESIDRMASALDAWNQSNDRDEATLKARAGTPSDLALLYIEQGRLDAATAAMTAAVHSAPTRAPLHLFLGLLHDSAGRRAEAAAAFRTAWELDGANAIHAYLAATRGSRESTDDALTPFAAALMNASAGGRAPFIQLSLVDDRSAKTPIFAPAAYAAGFAAVAQGRYRDAIAQFRETAGRDPLVTDATGRNDRVRQGVAALRDRRGADAVTHLEAAAAADAKSSEARRVLGIAYRAVGRIADGVTQFEAAVTLAPRDERTRIALAGALIEAGDLPRAERLLRETIETLPASGEARWALADVLEKQGRGPDAIDTLEAAASLTVLAGKAALFWRIAELAHRHQDYERVIRALSERVRLLPNEAIAYKDLGLAYSRAGRHGEALVELLMSSFLGHEDAELLAAIGQIHLNAGRLDAAEPPLRRAIALDPRLPQARYVLGNALMRLGRAAEGKQQLEEFQRLRSAALADQRRTFEIGTLIHEAELLVRAGRLEAAISPYEKAAALGGPAVVYRELAAIFEKLGRAADRAKALAAYEQRRNEEAR
jgi:tetratricopeptide (TPR) repeat protein